MRRYLLAIIGAVLVIAGLFFYQQHVNGQLAAARHDAKVANAAAEMAFKYADSATAAASARAAQAVKATVKRTARAPATARIIARSPDVCGPVITALKADLADADSASASWQSAYESEKAAAGRLSTAGHTAVDASHELVKASGGFWKSITPRIGVGAGVGLSVINQKPDAIIGITLGWKF